MHSHSFVNYLSILLAFVAAAIAAPGPGFPPRYPTKCFTSIVTRPPRGPQTTWSTLTTSCISTNTVTSTIRPSTTSTITDTTTVTSTASTSTFTATETITSTITDTSVTTSVSTSTSTTETVSTSIIATSVGFLPVGTTVPGASFNRDGDPIKRDLSVGVDTSANTAVPKRAFSPANLGGRGDVSCYEYHSSCSTTTTTLTTTASTRTFSTTITSTSTFTTTPGASTTVTSTDTTTTTLISTETSTTVTVVTSFTSTTSTYAACATNNQANFVNSLPVVGFFANGLASVTGATDEYDCCVSAIVNPNGAFWAWSFDLQQCFVATVNTCAVGQGSNGVGNTIQVDIDQTNTTPDWGVGNTNCGRWDSFVTDE